jgi:hypothetical protein
MLVRAADKDLVRGLLEDFKPGAVISQYADDTMLFTSCEISYLKNLKVILMRFEKVFGMRINFHKSEIILMNLGPEQVHEVMHIMN